MTGFERPARERPGRRVARTAPPPEPAGATTDVAAVLRLQALAGNRATSRLVARAPADEPAPAAPGGRATGYTMKVAGFGEYAVASFQAAGKTALAVTFTAGPDSARLLHAASNGDPIASVVIASATHTITLTDAVIASVSQAQPFEGGEPMVSVEFNGVSLAVE